MKVTRLLAVCALFGQSACGPEEDEFHFGQAEMEAFIFGTWTGTWQPEGESSSALTLEIRGKDEPTRSPACTNRHFSADDGETPRALQCGSASHLDISATLSVDNGSMPEELDGNFIAYGTELGNYSLHLGNLDYSRHLGSEYLEGEWRGCSVSDDSGTGAVCTLDARSE